MRRIDAVRPCCCDETLVVGDKDVELVTEVQCGGQMDRIR